MSRDQHPDAALANRRRRGARARAVALDLADDAIRQGLKRPIPSPARLARRVLGRDRLADAVRGQVVVVTGASSGIGEATAHRFAAAGAKVLLVARREAELARVTALIECNGGAAQAYRCDLSDLADIDLLVAQLLSDHAAVDILINNAGRSIRRSIVDSLNRFHDFERTMALNYFGPVALSLGLLPAMLAQGRGQVINISTWATQLPSPQYVAYTSSKAALDAFTRGTAAEMLGTGVALTSVHLPLVRTPMITPALDAYRGMPSLSAHEAAGLIAEAAVIRSSRIEPALVTIGHVGDAISSRATDLIMGSMQKVGLGPVGRRR